MEDPRCCDPWLIVAGINGVLAVAALSWAAHGAGNSFQMDSASRLHMYHSLALLAVAFLARLRGGRLIWLAGWAFLAGIALFCGLIYVHVFFDWRELSFMVPGGGVAFMVGWLCLALSGVTCWRRRSRGA